MTNITVHELLAVVWYIPFVTDKQSFQLSQKLDKINMTASPKRKYSCKLDRSKIIPGKEFSWGMNALHIICIQPKTTHCWKRLISYNIEEFCINIHNCSCCSIVRLPPVSGCDTILFQCEVLKHKFRKVITEDT